MEEPPCRESDLNKQLAEAFAGLSNTTAGAGAESKVPSFGG